MEIRDIKTAADMLQYLADHKTKFVLREQSETVAFKNAGLLAKVEPTQLHQAIVSVMVSHLPHDQFCSLIDLALDILRMDKQLDDRDIYDA